LLLTGLVVGLHSVCCSFAPRSPGQAGTPSAPRRTQIFDPDPQHLWNRLYDASRALIKGAETSDPWELDPFLWRSDAYVFTGQAQKSALEVLDEFIARGGHTLVKDPLKRALLQRDLWALFDSLQPPRWGAGRKNPETELARRLARILPRLGLTGEEIKRLPDNYAQAVAAKEAPGGLWDPEGPWVLLGDQSQLPLALTHVHFFGGRSTFFVFLRLPGGREKTEQFLDDLRKRGTDATPLPAETQVVLLRLMQLIDEQGKPVTTRVTETLQMRSPAVLELKLSRRAFLEGKPSLKVVGEDDRERDFLLFMGHNAGAGPSQVLKSCFHCHQGGGIRSVLSYGRFTPLPLTPRVSPVLIASKREDKEMASRIWKGNRFEWGLLRGLIQSNRSSGGEP
jgi:hypothetical protein